MLIICQAALGFLALFCVLSPSPASAEGVGPAQLPEAARKGDLAKVLGVQPAGVSEARGYDLQAAGMVSGFTLGRYVQGGRAWTFPVLGVYAACATGTCISALRLGAASRRLAPLCLIDLEQPVAPVPRLDAAWLLAAVPQPSSPARWPVLLLVSERQLDEPATGELRRAGRSAEARTEQTLYVVSLQIAGAPKLLYSGTLVERGPEPERNGHAPRSVGSQIEELRLGRQGQELVMVISQRDIDSRYSRGLRPEPIEHHYRLVGERFAERY